MALTQEEETLLLNLVLRFLDRGMPMKRLHVQEADSLVVSQLPLERRQVLPFKNGIPEKSGSKTTLIVTKES